jgi:arylsulfatase A-like enzyme
MGRPFANFYVAVLVSSFAILLAVGCSRLGEAAQEEKVEASVTQPNIIFVLADDLDFASTELMPNLRSLLAEEGAIFEGAFASYPICCPARATILTGLYSHNHNVRGNKRPAGGFEKFVSEGHEENTIAVRLQEEGYRTALIGKYLNGYGTDDPSYVPLGWDEWYAKPGRFEYYDYELNENGQLVSYGSEEGDYLTDVLSGHANDFVRRASSEGRPFFAYVAPTAPHSPAIPAERHEGVFSGAEAPRTPSFGEEDVSDKPAWVQDLEPGSQQETSRIDKRYQDRLESMLAVDEMVASLLQGLEDAGELDNTYLFFTSDNGFHLGTHRLGHGKKTPYEEAAHVPLFVRGPEIPAGTKMGNLVLDTDFAPTFADLAGVEGFEADGRSLLPLMRGEAPPWRSAVLLEAFLDGRSARAGEDEQAEDEKVAGKESAGKNKGDGTRTDQTAFQAVRTETHKYVEHDNGEKELYDLEADPYELESIHESTDSSLVEDLKAKLDTLRSCSEDGCQEAEDAR